MKTEKNPINILLVEDSETDVKIILHAFEKQKLSCQVQTVSDGQKAMDYLLHKGEFKDKTVYPDPEIILLDIHMPRMDGHTFVRELRATESAKEIPIVVFTSREGMEGIFQIEGVNDYVVKTIDGVDLVRKIREIIKFKQEFFND